MHCCPRSSPRTAVTRVSRSPSASARSAARPKKAIAAAPSPSDQAASARFSRVDVESASAATLDRLGPDEVHRLGVPTLQRLVPVAAAVDVQLRDPVLGDQAVQLLPAVPLLALGRPALL